jgi:acyl-homoserine-lactone acylase
MLPIRRTVALSAAVALLVSLAVATTTATTAMAAGAPLEPPGGTYDATITRTEHGIPHIVANDWASLGYGHGYATAQTSICNLADTLLTARGQRSRYLGPDGRYQDRVSLDATNLQTDTFFTDLHNRHVVEDLLADPVRGPGDQARAMVKGYVAGVNTYLHDVGEASGVEDETCRGKAYLQPATELDLWYGVYAANLLASAGPFVAQIADASPPTLTDPGLPLIGGLKVPTTTSTDAPEMSAAEADRKLPYSKPPSQLPSSDELKAELGKDPEGAFGSNATALGGDSTATGRGMILGNPHFPWHGRYRFAQAQLTIPGEYDVAGAALLGSPVINIGFNHDVAWSHTVSTAYRFTPYEYRLLPGLHTKYVTDHGIKTLEKRSVDVQVKQPDNSIKTVTRTMYRTEDGYVMDAPDSLMGWTSISVFAMRDANGEHLRTIDSFLDMGKASTVGQLLSAQDHTAGIPWVNTIAADRAGNALYADHSVVPNVPNSMVSKCITPIGRVTQLLAGLPVLNGTRAQSTCAWKNDADAERPGVFGPSHLPDTTRRDWVANANDSYWLPNPNKRLEGFASIIGCEKCERTLRTRMVYRYVTDALASGLISQEQLRGFEHENRVMGAEVTRAKGDLDKTCQAAKGGAACDVLHAWDGRTNTDSVGAHIFQEFFQRTKESRWQVKFRASDPLNTPRDLKERSYLVVKAMKDALAYLQQKGVPFNAPLGTLQVADKSGPALPIGGGTGETGNANVVMSEAPVENPKALYTVNYGSSHIQAVSFTDTGVQASTILTYGQSLDSSTPWYSDQTTMFGHKQWVDFPFTDAQIADQEISTQHVTGGP